MGVLVSHGSSGVGYRDLKHAVVEGQEQCGVGVAMSGGVGDELAHDEYCGVACVLGDSPAAEHVGSEAACRAHAGVL